MLLRLFWCQQNQATLYHEVPGALMCRSSHRLVLPTFPSSLQVSRPSLAMSFLKGSSKLSFSFQLGSGSSPEPCTLHWRQPVPSVPRPVREGDLCYPIHRAPGARFSPCDWEQWEQGTCPCASIFPEGPSGSSQLGEGALLP